MNISHFDIVLTVVIYKYFSNIKKRINRYLFIEFKSVHIKPMYIRGFITFLKLYLFSNSKILKWVAIGATDKNHLVNL